MCFVIIISQPSASSTEFPSGSLAGKPAVIFSQDVFKFHMAPMISTNSISHVLLCPVIQTQVTSKCVVQVTGLL